MRAWKSQANVPTYRSFTAKVGLAVMGQAGRPYVAVAVGRAVALRLANSPLCLQAGGQVDRDMVRDLARLMPDPAGSDDLLAPGVLQFVGHAHPQYLQSLRSGKVRLLAPVSREPTVTSLAHYAWHHARVRRRHCPDAVRSGC
jgi:hypothetical protein